MHLRRPERSPLALSRVLPSRCPACSPLAPSRCWLASTAVAPTTPKALADAEQTQPQSLTRVFASIEEQGLVSHQDDPAAARCWSTSPRPAGKSYARAARRISRGSWLVDAMDAEPTPAEREIKQIAAQVLDRFADHQR